MVLFSMNIILISYIQHYFNIYVLTVFVVPDIMLGARVYRNQQNHQPINKYIIYKFW